MDRRTRLIAAGALTVAVVGGGTGFAIAAGGEDDEPLTGSALEQATAAALEHTGGGTVVESEVGDAGEAYGVAVRLDDGRVVEVELDENFQVIGGETDHEGSNDDEGSGEEDGPGDE